MRRRAERLLRELIGAGDPDLDYVASLSRRVSLLADSPRPLLFGRIDEEDGASWHIGRRHVEDTKADPVVVDWRAPVAVPFYRASAKDALGLARRRQIMVDRRTVVAVADDLFGGADDVASTRLRGGDALLAELERARTGEMLDIVATIQAEQDEIIRAPLDRLLTVQGGPGTGKTAVGLHRAAFLLYNHPNLSRDGVLVLGPSRAFLRYIAAGSPLFGRRGRRADDHPRHRTKGKGPPARAHGRSPCQGGSQNGPAPAARARGKTPAARGRREPAGAVCPSHHQRRARQRPRGLHRRSARSVQGEPPCVASPTRQRGAPGLPVLRSPGGG